MTDRKLPELFAERPVSSEFARHQGPRRGPPYAVRRLITLLVLFAVIAGGLYWKFKSPSQTLPGEIPTIKAEGAYKQRPDQPGGLEIPNQDVQVYQQIDNQAPPKPEVEHLLPPPEVPTAPAAQITPLPPTPQQLESLTPEKKMATTATQSETAPAPLASPPAAVSAPVAASTPAPPPSSKATPQMAPAVSKPPTVAAAPAPKTIDDVLKDVKATKATSGHSAVQLASVQDQMAAEALMQKLAAQYASILGTTELHLVKADLGARGIYYRIQSVGMTADQAKTLCSALKNAQAGCILVH